MTVEYLNHRHESLKSSFEFLIRHIVLLAYIY